MTSEMYPSGRVVTTGYDSANRPATVSGTPAGGVTTAYVSGMHYWPHGAPFYYTYANNVTHAAGYNSQLQPVEMYDSIYNGNDAAHMYSIACPKWGTSNNQPLLYAVCPAVSATRDNGNLLGVNEYIGGNGASQYQSFGITYGYDSFNRLNSASDTGGWSRKFSYDAYGNMWVPSHTGPLDPTTPITNIYSNNRIVGGSYDPSGNQSSVNGNTAYYYPEGQVGSVVDGVYKTTTSYGYDGQRNRVIKNVPNGTTIYVYDANNQLAAEYSTVPQSASPCLTCYLSMDHLGSTRLVTDASARIISRHDYAPFGDEVTRGAGWGPGTDNINQKFTGQEHDTETAWISSRLGTTAARWDDSRVQIPGMPGRIR